MVHDSEPIASTTAPTGSTVAVAAPVGMTSSATPARPISTPTSLMNSGRFPCQRSQRTSQRGTVATSTEERPEGTR